MGDHPMGHCDGHWLAKNSPMLPGTKPRGLATDAIRCRGGPDQSARTPAVAPVPPRSCTSAPASSAALRTPAHTASPTGERPPAEGEAFPDATRGTASRSSSDTARPRVSTQCLRRARDRSTEAAMTSGPSGATTAPGQAARSASARRSGMPPSCTAAASRDASSASLPRSAAPAAVVTHSQDSTAQGSQLSDLLGGESRASPLIHADGEAVREGLCRS